MENQRNVEDFETVEDLPTIEKAVKELNYMQVLELSKESNLGLEVIKEKVNLFVFGCREIGKKAVVCHATLKAMNDKYFPRNEKGERIITSTSL
jgi:hypothetical protein